MPAEALQIAATSPMTIATTEPDSRVLAAFTALVKTPETPEGSPFSMACVRLVTP